jgi:hypothetical protein
VARPLRAELYDNAYPVPTRLIHCPTAVNRSFPAAVNAQTAQQAVMGGIRPK